MVNKITSTGREQGKGSSNGASVLTDASLIRLEYFPPPADLQHLITTFYHFRCDERAIRDVQPAAVGALVVFLKGEGKMHFADRVDPSHQLALLSPTSVAAGFEVDGPFHCVGAALSPLGWASLTGLRADEHCDRMFDACDILGEESGQIAQRLRQGYAAGTIGPEEICTQLSEMIAARLKPVNPRHAALIGLVSQWLSQDYNPSIDELAQRSGYSVRQLQRLVERYFGITPKQLIRKYRALRVAAFLQDPQTSDDQVAELLNQFYDQSHLIREIRKFTGRTPARLGDGESPILNEILHLRNFREITPNVASIPGD